MNNRIDPPCPDNAASGTPEPHLRAYPIVALESTATSNNVDTAIAEASPRIHAGWSYPTDSAGSQLVPIDHGGSISIFELPAFPFTTKPSAIKPEQLRVALLQYQSCKTALVEVLKCNHIDYVEYCELQAQWPEIGRAHTLARQRKAEQYAGAAQELYDNNIPQEFYEQDRFGCKKLSNAGINYLKNKHEAYLRHAAAAETGSYVPAQKQDITSKSTTTSRGIMVNVSLQDLREMGIDDLIDGLDTDNRQGAHYPNGVPGK